MCVHVCFVDTGFHVALADLKLTVNLFFISLKKGEVTVASPSPGCSPSSMMKNFKVKKKSPCKILNYPPMMPSKEQ